MNRLTEHFFRAPTGVFTLSDVAVSVDGTDFRRHGLIKRAMSAGEILNIRRGLYCLAPEFQKKPVSVYSLAQRIYGPSYISMETALSYHGWIPEAVYACTCVTSATVKNSRHLCAHSVTSVFHSIRSSLALNAATMKTAMFFS